MASISVFSNKETIPEMPSIRKMVDELRESSASSPQSINTSLPNEDLQVKEALLIPNELESRETNENKNEPGDLSEALNSTSKCFSMVLNRSACSSSEDQPASATTDDTQVQQVSTVQPVSTPPSVPMVITTQSRPQKPHIMISYSRSCEDGCRKIRNSLKELKYKVWMDVYDMRDNFIDGMAKAIQNSYIVLMCINRDYETSFWCKKEAEDIAIRKIKCIPCFMETPFRSDTWLSFLTGANVYVDFSSGKEFDEAFGELIREITSVEERLATHPRETPPLTPTTDSFSTSTAVATTPTNLPTNIEFDNIARTFKTWVEANREVLQRTNRQESIQLIQQLLQSMKNDDKTENNQNKDELLQQLIETSQSQWNRSSLLTTDFSMATYPMLKGLLVILALWAIKVIYKRI